ncbi:transmembrane protein 98 [Ditylenchus destructor]|nr:transmembrane protein 98 [Ditylenchus destructor]
MDIVVYLALAVLLAVFLFSLFILIVMCHRKYEYNRLLMAHSLRFSKLRQESLDIIQLGPHISQKLSTNQWVEEVSGMLADSVAVLKLCHVLTDQMSKIPLNQIGDHLNEIICQATTRVVPRFDALLRSMAAKNVDIRVIESRVAALVTACWSLVIPFYILNPKYKELFGELVQEMEKHHGHLLLALEQVERLDINQGADGEDDDPSSETVLRTSQEDGTSPPLIKSQTESGRHMKNGGMITLRMPDESKKPLNNDSSTSSQEDQAPADPISTSVTAVT